MICTKILYWKTSDFLGTVRRRDVALNLAWHREYIQLFA